MLSDGALKKHCQCSPRVSGCPATRQGNYYLEVGVASFPCIPDSGRSLFPVERAPGTCFLPVRGAALCPEQPSPREGGRCSGAMPGAQPGHPSRFKSWHQLCKVSQWSCHLSLNIQPRKG